MKIFKADMIVKNIEKIIFKLHDLVKNKGCYQMC